MNECAGMFYSLTAEPILWTAEQIERVWEKIVGDEKPNKDDGELFERRGDGEIFYWFKYKGEIRATARAYFNFYSGTWRFEAELKK